MRPDINLLFLLIKFYRLIMPRLLSSLFKPRTQFLIHRSNSSNLLMSTLLFEEVFVDVFFEEVSEDLSVVATGEDIEGETEEDTKAHTEEGTVEDIEGETEEFHCNLASFRTKPPLNQGFKEEVEEEGDEVEEAEDSFPKHL